MRLYIKELREEKGLTQKELADLCHVSFQTISKWENGINYPDITHIPRLSDIFGVSADVILGLVPFENKDERKRYDEVDFWTDKRDVVKVWKNLYWNDDYFKFFIKDVLGFRKAVKVLDFGCGYGFLGMKMLPVLPKGSSYTGIELDSAQIEEAKGYFSETEYAYRFICEDMYEYEPDEKYDLAVALFLISYLPEPEKFIRKMKASLKPGGMILLMDANMEVEQAGFYSGAEAQDEGMRRPEMIPLWEYEYANKERDYRMATKLPYMLKQEGFTELQARISDQVVIYEPSDPGKKKLGDMLRFVYSKEDFVNEGAEYFLKRGYSRQQAEDMTAYFKHMHDYLDSKQSIAVKTSGVYFVYGRLK